MKKYKPLRHLVTTYVVATARRKPQKKTSYEKAVEFFEGLHERVPVKFNSQSQAEIWIIQIRKEMDEKGTWIRGREDQIPEFVAEFIVRLQRALYDSVKPYVRHYADIDLHLHEREVNMPFYAFRKIYLKIRVWGLRTKCFKVSRWKRTSYRRFIEPIFCIRVYPADYLQKAKLNQPSFYLSTHISEESFFKRIIMMNIKSSWK